ncbi:hypothetical protein BLNAU_10386 [Blattamonas nauphoetae]|uniref:UDENN domain-containing protein n=1 Tax=Blattamonas nauphoetae TaxID=2049346 RepID=A0ABQ9XTD1_9EUKA|nr:hypothetical protein BLNAU_10386 [Blattamonas nauphoetae]
MYKQTDLYSQSSLPSTETSSSVFMPLLEPFQNVNPFPQGGDSLNVFVSTEFSSDKSGNIVYSQSSKQPFTLQIPHSLYGVPTDLNIFSIIFQQIPPSLLLSLHVHHLLDIPIIITGASPAVISYTCFSIVHLFLPFSYCGQFIPLIPAHLSHVAEVFMPSVIGILPECLSSDLSIYSSAIMVNLSDKRVILPNNDNYRQTCPNVIPSTISTSLVWLPNPPGLTQATRDVWDLLVECGIRRGEGGKNPNPRDDQDVETDTFSGGVSSLSDPFTPETTDFEQEIGSQSEDIDMDRPESDEDYSDDSDTLKTNRLAAGRKANQYSSMTTRGQRLRRDVLADETVGDTNQSATLPSSGNPGKQRVSAFIPTRIASKDLRSATNIKHASLNDFGSPKRTVRNSTHPSHLWGAWKRRVCLYNGKLESVWGVQNGDWWPVCQKGGIRNDKMGRVLTRLENSEQRDGRHNEGQRRKDLAQVARLPLLKSFYVTHSSSATGFAENGWVLKKLGANQASSPRNIISALSNNTAQSSLSFFEDERTHTKSQTNFKATELSLNRHVVGFNQLLGTLNNTQIIPSSVIPNNSSLTNTTAGITLPIGQLHNARNIPFFLSLSLPLSYSHRLLLIFLRWHAAILTHARLAVKTDTKTFQLDRFVASFSFLKMPFAKAFVNTQHFTVFVEEHTPLWAEEMEKQLMLDSYSIDQGEMDVIGDDGTDQATTDQSIDAFSSHHAEDDSSDSSDDVDDFDLLFPSPKPKEMTETKRSALLSTSLSSSQSSLHSPTPTQPFQSKLRLNQGHPKALGLLSKQNKFFGQSFSALPVLSPSTDPNQTQSSTEMMTTMNSSMNTSDRMTDQFHLNQEETQLEPVIVSDETQTTLLWGTTTPFQPRLELESCLIDDEEMNDDEEPSGGEENWIDREENEKVEAEDDDVDVTLTNSLAFHRAKNDSGWSRWSRKWKVSQEDRINAHEQFLSHSGMCLGPSSWKRSHVTTTFSALCSPVSSFVGSVAEIPSVSAGLTGGFGGRMSEPRHRGDWETGTEDGYVTVGEVRRRLDLVNRITRVAQRKPVQNDLKGEKTIQTNSLLQLTDTIPLRFQRPQLSKEDESPTPLVIPSQKKLITNSYIHSGYPWMSLVKVMPPTGTQLTQHPPLHLDEEEPAKEVGKETVKIEDVHVHPLASFQTESKETTTQQLRVPQRKPPSAPMPAPPPVFTRSAPPPPPPKAKPQNTGVPPVSDSPDPDEHVE